MRLTVVRRSSSMMPTLSVYRGRASRSSTRREQGIDERDFLGSMQFGFDDVDRTRARILAGACAAQIVQRDERCDRGVDECFRNGLAGESDRIGTACDGRRCVPA